MADTHMCMKLDERLESACINGLHKAGYWFDFVNDDVLERWDEYPYDTLLLIECERIPVSSMEKIQEIAKKGGKILAAERLPEKSCGLIGYWRDSQRVEHIGREMKAKGEVCITKDKFESLQDALQSIKKPDVKISSHPDVIGYVHRKTDTEDIYFVSNISPEDYRENMRFHNQNRNFCVFDPMTGEEKEVHSWKKDGEDMEVTLTMEGFQSLIFVFADGMEEPVTVSKEQEEELLLDISKGWTLEVPEKEFRKEYESLKSWEQEPELAYYSGTGVYSGTFEISREQWEKIAEASRVMLKFAHVGETAEIYLNGMSVETLIKRPYRIDIRKALREGINEIRVHVTNLLINRMIDPEYPEPAAPKNIRQWPYATGSLEQCRKERLYNWREREMIKKPVASGLWGEIGIVKN